MTLDRYYWDVDTSTPPRPQDIVTPDDEPIELIQLPLCDNCGHYETESAEDRFCVGCKPFVRAMAYED